MRNAKHPLDILDLTASIVRAHVANNSVLPEEVAVLIRLVREALQQLPTAVTADTAKPEPAIPRHLSVQRDHIVCLEDGVRLKTLRRYLRERYNMTPEQYREKWDLPREYPMVAPSYAQTRRLIALGMGLGRRPIAVAKAPPPRSRRIKQ